LTLGLFVPTRERPENAVRLARAVTATATPGFTTLIFLLDYDDPLLDDYLRELAAAGPSVRIMITPPGGPQRMGPVLNWAAALRAPDYGFAGFMGDDHLPVTPGWDAMLCEAVGARPGVAYGNDLFQGAALPTAVVMSSVLVTILGYMSPPPLIHLWIDDFWRTLGQATHLEYRDRVIIEHLHPAAAKAPMDASYAGSGCNPELMHDDGWRWRQWHRNVWPGELTRLKQALGAA
jgi:hypothetical protein